MMSVENSFGRSARSKIFFANDLVQRASGTLSFTGLIQVQPAQSEVVEQKRQAGRNMPTQNLEPPPPMRPGKPPLSLTSARSPALRKVGALAGGVGSGVGTRAPEICFLPGALAGIHHLKLMDIPPGCPEAFLGQTVQYWAL